MSNCFRFLLLVTVCLYIRAISAKDYDVKMCWTQSEFEDLLNWQCSNYARKRGIRKEALVKSEKEAKHFLKKLTRREAVSVEGSEPTNYLEECCVEGCKIEEIAEYCWL